MSLESGKPIQKSDVPITKLNQSTVEEGFGDLFKAASKKPLQNTFQQLGADIYRDIREDLVDGADKSTDLKPDENPLEKDVVTVFTALSGQKITQTITLNSHVISTPVTIDSLSQLVDRAMVYSKKTQNGELYHFKILGRQLEIKIEKTQKTHLITVYASDDLKEQLTDQRVALQAQIKEKTDIPDFTLVIETLTTNDHSSSNSQHQDQNENSEQANSEQEYVADVETP